MAVIGDLYATNVGTGTQILVASSTDLEKASVKYHPDTKDTFIVWEKDSTTTTVSRVRSGVVLSLDITTGTAATRFNLGLNGAGTKGLALGRDDIIGNKVVHIDLETMTEDNTDAVTNQNSPAIKCVWATIEEQYYLWYFTRLTKYNATTEVELYNMASIEASSYCVKEGKLYAVASTSLYRINDSGSAFNTEITKSTVLTGSGVDIIATDTKVVVLQNDAKLHYRDLDLENPTTIDLLGSYGITGVSTLHHIAGTERVFFCGTQGGIRKTFELLEDDSVEVYAAPLDPTASFGAYSNNNDAYGTEITYS